MVTAIKSMTLDEFLAMPETEPYSEFICGRVVQKWGNTPAAGMIAVEIGSQLGEFVDRNEMGWPMVSPLHVHRGESRAYLPTVAFVLKEHLPDRQTRADGHLEGVPDIAIEIICPHEPIGSPAEKLTFYMRNNTPLVWIIDPIDRTLDAYRPGQPSTHHTPGDIITAEPVLPDFRLDVGALFAVLGPGE